jgi:FkbM family methyltransferase
VPLISVVLPVVDGVRSLDRAVASLRTQTFADWELLAVDDASTDGAAARLAALAATDRRVRVFRHPTKRGPAAARNTALAAARGELVAYLGGDDEFYPDHLGRVREWRGRADVLLFQCDPAEEGDGPPRGTTAAGPPATALPGIVHRRALLARSGYFRELLDGEPGRDQQDLWARFAAAGATFVTVPHASGRTGDRGWVRPAAGGLPSPVGEVEVRVGERRARVRIATGEAWRARAVFERGEYAGLPARALRDPPAVVDVGANVGLFALYAKLVYHPAAVVHCFEPFPPSVELLRQNVAPFAGVTVHPVGLADADGAADLLLHPTNSGANSTRADLVRAPAGRVRVAVRDAAAVWDELRLGEVDVLKIDTEGAEVAILTALGPRLARARVVMAEYHTAADRRRIDALLPDHVLFGLTVHGPQFGVARYVRADLV